MPRVLSERLARSGTHAPAVVSGVRAGVLAVAVATVAVGLPGVVASAGAALPDGRGYELVSPVAKNGVSPYAAVPSRDGSRVDFQARGAFAGATSGSLSLYQATRGAGGWLTAALTPAPSAPLGAFEEQAPVWLSPDLSQTIFTTPESYAPGDSDGGSLDLYLRSAGGGLTWLSQGSQGGGEPRQVTFDGATPDGAHVVFSTSESLLAGATGLNPEGPPEAEYLYARDVAAGQTSLVDVKSGGELLNERGAVLGNGTALTSGPPPAGEFLPADASGSTTNAISEGGGKVFFESPAPGSAAPHEAVGLYMREGASTVQIAPSARYEGASADGSLVFYSSEEAGPVEITPAKRMFAFNTTGSQIGQVPAMSAIPISNGMNGDKTIETQLTEEAHFHDTSITVASTAGFTAGETLYLHTFFGTSFAPAKIASVTDGTHLALAAPGIEGGYTFTSTPFPVGDQVQGAPREASLTAAASDGSRVYFVSDGVLASNANSAGQSAVGFKPNLYLFDTGTGETTFIATLAGKDAQGEGGQPAGLAGEPDISREAAPSPDGKVLVFASAGNLTGQNPWEEFTEIYRYSVAGDQLVCVSCTAPGVKPAGNADFGETAGGTYDPPGLSSPMSEDGSRVFFDTPDSLVGEDQNGGAPASAKFGTPTSTDVYEWEAGKVYLISSGTSSTPAVLQGTTPSGNDVLFTTTAALAPQDVDGGFENVWDARVGGGFPAQGAGAPSCAGQGCRAAFGAPPVFTAPASVSLAGGGNLPAPPVGPGISPSPPKSTPKPKACRKGFTRRRVKGRQVCVRRKAHRASRARVGRVVNVDRTR